jgi:hypothetical protein
MSDLDTLMESKCVRTVIVTVCCTRKQSIFQLHGYPALSRLVSLNALVISWFLSPNPWPIRLSDLRTMAGITSKATPLPVSQSVSGYFPDTSDSDPSKTNPGRASLGCKSISPPGLFLSPLLFLLKPFRMCWRRSYRLEKSFNSLSLPISTVSYPDSSVVRKITCPLRPI